MLFPLSNSTLRKEQERSSRLAAAANDGYEVNLKKLGVGLLAAIELLSLLQDCAMLCLAGYGTIHGLASSEGRRDSAGDDRRDCLPHRPAEGQLFLHALGGVLSLSLFLFGRYGIRLIYSQPLYVLYVLLTHWRAKVCLTSLGPSKFGHNSYIFHLISKLTTSIVFLAFFRI